MPRAGTRSLRSPDRVRFTRPCLGLIRISSLRDEDQRGFRRFGMRSGNQHSRKYGAEPKSHAALQSSVVTASFEFLRCFFVRKKSECAILQKIKAIQTNFYTFPISNHHIFFTFPMGNQGIFYTFLTFRWLSGWRNLPFSAAEPALFCISTTPAFGHPFFKEGELLPRSSYLLPSTSYFLPSSTSLAFDIRRPCNRQWSYPKKLYFCPSLRIFKNQSYERQF